MDLLDRIAIWFIKRRIRKGWGIDCETLDYVDFPDLPHELNGDGRCAGCRAKEVYEWLQYWRSLT